MKVTLMTLILSLQVCHDVGKITWIFELITAQQPFLVLKLIIIRNNHCVDSLGQVVELVIIVL